MRLAIPRSCIRAKSATSASSARARSLATHCGRPEMLPLVMTTGRVMRRSIKWCSGVLGSMKPSRSRPGATASGKGSPLAFRSTIGAAGLSSSASSSSETAQ